jgi:hypothetical protein
MDSWLQRLVVRGPAPDVAAFRRAAASRSKPAYLTVSPELETQALSFRKLRDALAPQRCGKIDENPEEPWDLVVDPVQRFKDGTTEVTYRFQLSRFECEELIREVSKLYPQLCFVLGCVARANDEQSSRLMQRGRVSRWRLPDRIREAIMGDLPDETEDEDDEVAWDLAEADWAMMDTVVDHWRSKVDRLISRRTRASGRGSVKHLTVPAGGGRKRPKMECQPF